MQNQNENKNEITYPEPVWFTELKELCVYIHEEAVHFKTLKLRPAHVFWFLYFSGILC